MRRHDMHVGKTQTDLTQLGRHSLRVLRSRAGRAWHRHSVRVCTLKVFRMHSTNARLSPGGARSPTTTRATTTPRVSVTLPTRSSTARSWRLRSALVTVAIVYENSRARTTSPTTTRRTSRSRQPTARSPPCATLRASPSQQRKPPNCSSESPTMRSSSRASPRTPSLRGASSSPVASTASSAVSARSSR
jgi:hypothetical protein